MSTKDQTLKQFLSQFDLGAVKELPEAVMRQMGHSELSAGLCELLVYTLKRPFEEGELPVLAAGYLSRSGYRLVKMEKQKFSTEPAGFAANAGYTDGALVTGEDAEMGSIFIQVSYATTEVMFLKQSIEFKE